MRSPWPIGTRDTLPYEHILLLGAGFSKNWGGWRLADEVIDYPLTCTEVHRDSELKDLI